MISLGVGRWRESCSDVHRKNRQAVSEADINGAVGLLMLGARSYSSTSCCNCDIDLVHDNLAKIRAAAE
jgi:hypothetical protein